jgi:hypothetical protein
MTNLRANNGSKWSTNKERQSFEVSATKNGGT